MYFHPFIVEPGAVIAELRGTKREAIFIIFKLIE